MGRLRYTCKERSETGTSFAASPSSSVFLAKIGPHENKRRKVSIMDGPEAGAARGGQRDASLRVRVAIVQGRSEKFREKSTGHFTSGKTTGKPTSPGPP
jgi:hypothetical protein